MFCTTCGKQIPDESAFCTNCGTPVKVPAAAAPAVPETPAAPVAPAVSEAPVVPEVVEQPAPVAPAAPVVMPAAPVVQPPPMPAAPQPAMYAQPMPPQPMPPQPGMYGQPMPMAPQPAMYAQPAYAQPAPVMPNMVSPGLYDEEVSPHNRHLLMAMCGCFGMFGVHDYIAGRIPQGVTKSIIYVIGLIIYLATSYRGVGAFFGDTILNGLYVWVTVDLYLLALGKMADGRGRSIPKVMWGLTFAILWSIYAVVEIISSFALL